MSRAARQIYQAKLDAVSRAAWDGGAAISLCMIAVPHAIRSGDARSQVTTTNNPLFAMGKFHDSDHRAGARTEYRICDEKDVGSGAGIRGSHRTFVPCGKAHPNQMTPGLRFGIRSEVGTGDRIFVLPPLLARGATMRPAPVPGSASDA